MKILIDGRVLKHKNTTGVERYTRGIIKVFKKMDVDYQLAIPSLENRYYHHIWEQFALPVLTRKYDILFCPANISPLFKFGEVKLVTVFHGFPFFDYPRTYSAGFTRYYQLILPRVIHISDAIITVSESEKGKLIQRFPAIGKKITVIQNGIDEIFLAQKENIVRDKKDYLVYVGSFNPVKNLVGLLLAFRKILARIPHRLFIVGAAAPVFRSSDRLISVLKDIPQERLSFLGAMSDDKLVEIYRQAAAAVFPSFYEGSPFPPLEAMGCGCPVIVSDIPALRERCGDAAYYVNPYDIDSIARGIDEVVSGESLKWELIQKGLERVKLFSWRKTAEETLKVFANVSGKKQ